MSSLSVADAADDRDGIDPHVKVRWHPLGKGLVKHMKPLEFSLEERRDDLGPHRTSVRSR